MSGRRDAQLALDSIVLGQAAGLRRDTQSAIKLLCARAHGGDGTVQKYAQRFFTDVGAMALAAAGDIEFFEKRKATGL